MLKNHLHESEKGVDDPISQPLLIVQFGGAFNGYHRRISVVLQKFQQFFFFLKTQHHTEKDGVKLTEDTATSKQACTNHRKQNNLATKIQNPHKKLPERSVLMKLKRNLI